MFKKKSNPDMGLDFNFQLKLTLLWAHNYLQHIGILEERLGCFLNFLHI